MADFTLPDDIRDQTRAVWHRYLDSLTPFRADLHRYCQRLTANVLDAEDLVQDTLLRGFATLASVHGRIENPRAYLMRVATNLWIDTVRRRKSEASKMSQEATPATSNPTSSNPAACRMRRRTNAAAMALDVRTLRNQRVCELFRLGFRHRTSGFGKNKRILDPEA